MAAPTIDIYGNIGTEAAEVWTIIEDVGGFSELRFTDDAKVNMPIPPAGTDYTHEIWIIATVDDEICDGDDLYTQDATDKVLAVEMTNNDTNNPFTNVQITVWDNNDETGTTKPITDTADTSVIMRAASTGYYAGAPGVGGWTSLGPWVWGTIGGATKVSLQGSGTLGQVTDTYSAAFSENIAVDNTAVPGDNTHYMTISYNWT